MKKQPLTITIRIQVKPGMEEKFKQEYLSIVTFTLDEEGCISYNLYQSQTDPSVFMLYENWVSKEVFHRHLQMSYMKVIDQKADEFLAEPLEINLWDKTF